MKFHNLKDTQSPSLRTLIYISWLEGSQKWNSSYKITKEKKIGIKRGSYKKLSIISDFKNWIITTVIAFIAYFVSGTMLHA